VFCPKCGNVGESYKIAGKRPGLRCCKACRKQFRVTVGTVYESSHIPVHKWLQATYLLASSKKGMSAHQMHRMLGVTYKTGWFMLHRIREAMNPGQNLPPLGGEGKDVEADETFIGNRGKNQSGARGYKHQNKILSLVERGGKARSFHVDDVKAKTLKPIIDAQVDKQSRLMTDEANQYKPIGKAFAGHGVVMHSASQYRKGDACTNTIEGFFSIFKRGMKGVYQHCGEQHLQRYLHEFDFRYSNREALGVNDTERANVALAGIVGKRLTYRWPD
jgi:transposase-like protein